MSRNNNGYQNSVQLPVFVGVRDALENTVKRDKGIWRAGNKKKMKRRIQLKMKRKGEQMTCKEWSKKHGRDCYGDDDAQDAPNGPKLEPSGQKKQKGCKRCGSNTHSLKTVHTTSLVCLNTHQDKQPRYRNNLSQRTALQKSFPSKVTLYSLIRTSLAHVTYRGELDTKPTVHSTQGISTRGKTCFLLKTHSNSEITVQCIKHSCQK